MLSTKWRKTKARAINTLRHDIMVTDRKAIERAIQEYGQIGVIAAVGEVKYNDEDRSFQMWHQRLKGSISKYAKERIRRGAWSHAENFIFRWFDFS
jgi:hypothetical protein